jgi:hypothetical protein
MSKQLKLKIVTPEKLFLVLMSLDLMILIEMY